MGHDGSRFSEAGLSGHPYKSALLPSFFFREVGFTSLSRNTYLQGTRILLNLVCTKFSMHIQYDVLNLVLPDEVPRVGDRFAGPSQNHGQKTVLLHFWGRNG